MTKSIRCYNPRFFVLALVPAVLVGCGGGGGGGSDGSSGNGGGGSNGATRWEINAAVSKDTCGERIANVRQIFSIVKNGSAYTVDTAVQKVPAALTTAGFEFEYAQSTGSCTRTFHATLSSLSDDATPVTLTKSANCGGSICEREWTGTATKID